MGSSSFGRAQRELASFPTDVYGRIVRTISALSQEPRPSGSRKPSGRDGWRLRVGNYRVIYDIDDDEMTVTVLQVGHRRDVYR